MPRGYINERKSRFGRDEGEKEFKLEKLVKKTSAPITPKMLVRALRSLKKKSFKSLFFKPKEVAFEILARYPGVEQNMEMLLLEVSDKLMCACAAGLIGIKQGSGYYALDLRQDGVRSDTKSELMFWIFYRKILNRKAEEEKRRHWSEKND